ncbi:MAG TPA: DUF6184 family natural product biosynthesis lipoprotein [Polyangiaceae bacterium]|nr:DUF6184 family natural product biosynthesis lipoprotein [Polyangiaceae bacterium]
MQKTLACAAMLIAASLVGCGKDKYPESAKGGYEVQPRGHSVPTTVARAEPKESEEQLDIESEWTTEPAMTPASGTRPMTPASGTTSETAGTVTSPEGLGAGGPIVLQYEGANYLSEALCKHETACGNVGPTEGWCEEVVKSQLMESLNACDQGLSRTELRQCLSAIDQSSCETSWTEETAKEECASASLCAR